MDNVEFTWRGVTFVVRLKPHGEEERFVYRDKAHLGGPWTDLDKAVSNTSLELSFRRALRKAKNDYILRDIS